MITDLDGYECLWVGAPTIYLVDKPIADCTDTDIGIGPDAFEWGVFDQAQGELVPPRPEDGVAELVPYGALRSASGEYDLGAEVHQPLPKPASLTESFRIPHITPLFFDGLVLSKDAAQSIKLDEALGASEGRARLVDAFGDDHEEYRYVSWPAALGATDVKRIVQTVSLRRRLLLRVQPSHSDDDLYLPSWLVHESLARAWEKLTPHCVYTSPDQSKLGHPGIDYSQMATLAGWQRGELKNYFPE